MVDIGLVLCCAARAAGVRATLEARQLAHLAPCHIPGVAGRGAVAASGAAARAPCRFYIGGPSPGIRKAAVGTGRPGIPQALPQMS